MFYRPRLTQDNRQTRPVCCQKWPGVRKDDQEQTKKQSKIQLPVRWGILQLLPVQSDDRASK